MTNRTSHPRGSAFVTTMWVLVALSAIVLVLSRSMRVEAIASANRLSAAQAEATERGAEQFLCSVVDAEIATPGSTLNVSMEARQIGAGYFWVIRPDPDDETNRKYGLTDEAGKLDINTAPEAQIALLPNMPSDVAASIVNWRGVTPTTDGLGASDADYQSMNPAYSAKHAKFESTEEVLLIKNMTTDLLFGYDKNRDGVVDTNEMKSGGVSATVTAGASTSNRGIFPFITAYGVKATTSTTSSSSGVVRSVNVNTSSQQQMTTAFQAIGGRASAIVSATMSARGRGGRPGGPPPTGNFVNIFQWAAQVGLQSSEFSKIISSVNTTSATVIGGGGAVTTPAKVNVNTAPLQVLMCLPGMQESDAQAIVSYRQSNPTPTDPTDISWILDAVSKSTLMLPLATLNPGSYFTGKSFVFSGDIVAVSPDGRAFRRIRVVIDGSKTPSYVMYRRDLTGWGWPLPADIRTAMRSGNAPPDAGATVSSSNSLLGKGM